MSFSTIYYFICYLSGNFGLIMRLYNHVFLALLAAAGLASACTQEPAAPEAPGTASITLTLGAEQGPTPVSRVTFQNDRTFQWQDGDQVGAYVYSQSKKNVPGSYGVEGEYGPWMAPFTLTGGAGSATGQFTFHITDPENQEAVGHVAVYPLTDGTSYDEGTGVLTFNLPQYWQNVDNLSMVRIPMAANLDSEESPVMFKHIGGAVKVTFNNVPAGARYFKLTADKNISGAFTVNVANLGTAVLTGEGSATMVELQLTEGAATAHESLVLYFPVPAGTYTFGLGVYGDGVTYLEKQGVTPNTINRGTILGLPAVDCGVDYGEYDPDLPSDKKLSGITYQMNVFSFADSDGDGIGDFQGIIDKLDYLDALGVTAIWLSPIHPAQSYHGYDVTDYDSIRSDYGNKKDFKKLVAAAHARNMRIYLDYVINHSGNEHTWFLDAKRNGPESPYWNFYSFSASPEADSRAGNIDQIPAGWYDAGNWFRLNSQDPDNPYYYYSQFGTGMFADFNYYHGWNCAESPAFQAVTNAIATWLECGVDGLRLDAVKHVYADEGGEENIQFWQTFYNTVNSYYNTYAEFRENITGKADDNIFMVGEVLSGEDICRPFFAGLPAVFDFQFWWDLKGALNSENGSGICSGICDRYWRHKDVRADAIYTPKLSNHDENRTANDLGGYKPKIRLAATILLTSPGRPFIYQGEELGYWGYKGEGGDEYVRTPIMWNSDITSAAIAGVNGKYDADMLKAPIDVESQEADAGSLLNLYRRFAYARNINPALADGYPEYDSKTDGNTAVLCWYLHANDGSDKCCLVMHNITRETQTVERWDGENLSHLLVASDKVTVSGNKVTLAPYTSVVFAIN